MEHRMIRSMTGFGRATFDVGKAGQADTSTFEVEIRSVNHRHLDVRVKLPRAFTEGDGSVKAAIQARLARGKVDCTVSVPGGGAAQHGHVRVEAAVAGEYVAAARGLAEAHGLRGELDVATLIGMPGVVKLVEAEWAAEDLLAGLASGVAAALDALEAMRLAEGEALHAEFESRLVRVLELVASFEARSGQVMEAARERLRKRTEQIRRDVGSVDEARLHQEIVIAADRLDITEELVRLRSHVDQFRTILGEADASQPVGRRLDFLLQEMGREANTVGSKANDAPLAHDVVELKTELERLREQVQNVE
jgi:uncharacterized protein (TIGR00255 family)